LGKEKLLMKLSILTKWYNEEDLAPFFFNHYNGFADEILIYLDEGTNDDTEKIIKKYPKAKIIWAESSGKLDDQKCINELNVIAGKSDADWLMLVDADEYIFPEDFSDPREVLEKADGNLIYSAMWCVYTHETEKKIDPKIPPIFQRRHGSINRTTDPDNTNQLKPDIIRPYIGIQWGVGNHAYFPNDKIEISSTVFAGVHWQSVDIDLSIKRRIKGRKERHSDINLENGWGIHNFELTEQDILNDYELHKKDPQVF
jgi:hypothetical protein